MSAVISVGNLAMGGRGKTPVVSYLAQWLLRANERPAILSRGYGRRIVEDGVVIVSDGEHLLADVDRAGDEPFMLARANPGAAVCVCEQRAVAGAVAERTLGATVLVLDDGFQHRSMRRDVDLVIVQPSDLRARRVPFGPLRETRSALTRADAVIVDGNLTDADRPLIPVETFTLRRRVGAPVPLDPACPVPVAGSKVIGLAAIAEPLRFSRALEAAGWNVSKMLTFRDHHQYSQSDVSAMSQAMTETGAAGILTTEKDAVRLMAFRPLPVPIAFVPLTVDLEPSDRFDAWLRGRLTEIRRR